MLLLNDSAVLAYRTLRRVSLQLQVAHQCLNRGVIESCLCKWLLEGIANNFWRLNKIVCTVSCMFSLTTQNTCDVFWSESRWSWTSSHSCYNSRHFGVLICQNEVLFHDIAKNSCGRCHTGTTRSTYQFLLTCELLNETIHDWVGRTSTRFWHSSLIRCSKSINNETSAFQSVILPWITNQIHLFKLFSQTPLLNCSQLLTSLVAFTVFSLSCGR